MSKWILILTCTLAVSACGSMTGSGQQKSYSGAGPVQQLPADSVGESGTGAMGMGSMMEQQSSSGASGASGASGTSERQRRKEDPNEAPGGIYSGGSSNNPGGGKGK